MLASCATSSSWSTEVWLDEEAVLDRRQGVHGARVGERVFGVEDDLDDRSAVGIHRRRVECLQEAPPHRGDRHGAALGAQHPPQPFQVRGVRLSRADRPAHRQCHGLERGHGSHAASSRHTAVGPISELVDEQTVGRHTLAVQGIDVRQYAMRLLVHDLHEPMMTYCSASPDLWPVVGSGQ